MYDTSIVIMTALVPTIGHQYLIDFASNLAEKTHVILCGRSFEPINIYSRYDAFRKLYQANLNINFYIHKDNDAPQNISDSSNVDEFWNYWCKSVKNRVSYEKNRTVLVASENYGIEFAKRLGVSFIPCNISRDIFPIKGNMIRKDIVFNFGNILPTFRSTLARTYCFFGQESTGKTTMTKKMTEFFNGIYTPEWAREYLELIGPMITENKMETIVCGQYSSMISIMNSKNLKSPFIMRDTDLLSTIGYYRLWNNGRLPDNNSKVIQKFIQTKSDLYIVMSDDIPFEKDILRYGGNKRESTKQFWIDLLEEFGCNYIIVKSTDRSEQYKEIISYISKHMTDWLSPIKNFERT